jgi:alginate O-acetyltransferase complex protein AlgI
VEFNSLAFLRFFAVVFTVYWFLPWRPIRVLWLLAASYFFYASWSKELALVVASTSLMDYLLGRGMDATSRPWLRRALLFTSLAVNLGLLCYFKYVNFFLDSLRSALRAAGANPSIGVLEVIIPFGISFYTFEAISYTIDVYRGRMKAEKSLPNFMLFILFFPHLVAGPIVRAWDFLPQVARPRRWSWFRISLGMQLISVGLFKKLAIADRLAEYSDAAFAAPETFHARALWVGLIAFAIRIYCDFSGYSDMAVGTAHLFGFKLTRNFNLPYLACNISEFWRRWHISLSTWLRDYLFIPLGGSRGSNLATCRNLMITMALGGLWHGANWSYLVWGLIHGTLLVLHRLFRACVEERPRLRAMLDGKFGIVAGTGLTFFCVLLTWAFFQPSLKAGVTMLVRLFTFPEGGGFPFVRETWLATLGILIVGHLAVELRWWQSIWRRVPAPLAAAACVTVYFVAILFAPPEHKTFIYFQF